MHKRIGILGGMSPESTVAYYEYITRTYTERYAALSTRHYDLIIGYPFQSHFAYTVKLPAGWKVDGLPPCERCRWPFVSRWRFCAWCGRRNPRALVVGRRG